MNRIYTNILLIVFSILLFSCEKAESEFVEPTPTKLPYEFVGLKEIFGFYGQNRYSYCPSIVKLDDGTIHMYFCGNPTQNIMVDNIYHIRINPDSTLTSAKSVLQPGDSGSWDDHHTCDPSVVAGDFSMNGIRYKYAMFFLSNRYNFFYNEIGVAFSNDLEANNWVKYPYQIIEKSWSNGGDQNITSSQLSWGAGQPSAVSLDRKGQILLTYTLGDIDGTRILWTRLDFSDMNKFKLTQSTRMVTSGLTQLDYVNVDYTCDSDFGIDWKDSVITIVRPVQPNPSSYPAYLNISLEVDYMFLGDFLQSKGKWSRLLRITPAITKYPRNHNAAIERNMYGGIEDWETPTIYYTTSKASPDVVWGTKPAEWTYRIWRGKVRKN